MKNILTPLTYRKYVLHQNGFQWFQMATLHLTILPVDIGRKSSQRRHYCQQTDISAKSFLTPVKRPYKNRPPSNLPHTITRSRTMMTSRLTLLAILEDEEKNDFWMLCNEISFLFPHTITRSRIMMTSRLKLLAILEDEEKNNFWMLCNEISFLFKLKK